MRRFEEFGYVFEYTSVPLIKEESTFYGVLGDGEFSMKGCSRRIVGC
jgi:hypothetical protein